MQRFNKTIVLWLILPLTCLCHILSALANTNSTTSLPAYHTIHKRLQSTKTTIHQHTRNKRKMHKRKHVHRTIPSPTKPVDLNKASLVELESLKGIGPKRAKVIIDDRKKHGAFKSVNDLARIVGFNQQALKRLIKNNHQRIKV